MEEVGFGLGLGVGLGAGLGAGFGVEATVAREEEEEDEEDEEDEEGGETRTVGGGAERVEGAAGVVETTMRVELGAFWDLVERDTGAV